MPHRSRVSSTNNYPILSFYDFLKLTVKILSCIDQRNAHYRAAHVILVAT